MSDNAGLRVAIIGASGGIGRACVKHFAADRASIVYAFSRSLKNFDYSNVREFYLDLLEEDSVERAAYHCTLEGTLDIVIVASGILHHDDVMPEKSLKELSIINMEKIFAINTFGPALVAKHFLPILTRKKRVIFAALSARVGSITDNHLGGWYSYRASKAALNMLIKTASIEYSRQNRLGIVVGLHPGTVASELSAPFQKNVPPEKLFSADYSVTNMMAVLEGLDPGDTGKVFAWDGKDILS